MEPAKRIASPVNSSVMTFPDKKHENHEDHKPYSSVPMPSLASVRMDDEMTAEERATMIKKRNAIYSKRKYYKKKRDVAKLTTRRQGLEDHNAILKRENKRLQALLDDCQKKVQLFNANSGAFAHSMSSMRFASSNSVFPATLPIGACVASGSQLFNPAFGMSFDSRSFIPTQQQLSASLIAEKQANDMLETRLLNDSTLLLALLKNRV